MKPVKVVETSDAQLDWLVAKCEGLITVDGYIKDEYCDSLRHDQDVGFAHDWEQGGPILERAGVSITLRYHPDLWDGAVKPEFYSSGRPNSGVKKEVMVSGPTMLIAGLRAYVISCLGEEVEVPDNV